MKLAKEKILAPAVGFPAEARRQQTERQLRIYVVFTSTEGTREALSAAGKLAADLGACVTLLVPQIVPYPLPLETPPVLLEFNERRFSEVAKECPVETQVQIYLCRDRTENLTSVLKPHSIVVIGGKKHWWPTGEQTLAKALKQAGFEVIYKEIR